MIYYFTYGSDDRFPFQSGWTEVEAESYDQAVEAFQAFHPNRPGSDFINCAGIYGEDSFNRQRMAKEGNFGKKCVERIRVSNHKSTKTTDDNLVEVTVSTVYVREPVRFDALSEALGNFQLL